uniref:Uncharacterized protein n=1 Tax=Rhipicephalus zambeziensis TaxID=60191 RepID=A0A224YBK4_9ACAR
MPQGNHSPYPVAKLLFGMFLFFHFVRFYFVRPREAFGILFFFFFFGVIKRTQFKGFHAVACDAKAPRCSFARRSHRLLPTRGFLHAGLVPAMSQCLLEHLVHFTAACLVLLCLGISHLVIGDS